MTPSASPKIRRRRGDEWSEAQFKPLRPPENERNAVVFSRPTWGERTEFISGRGYYRPMCVLCIWLRKAAFSIDTLIDTPRFGSTMHNRFLFQNSMTNNSAETHVFNLPKLLSSVNRKTFHNVDMKGNAQLYTVGIKVYGTDAESIFSTAANTYVTRRAIKAWHDARETMYKRAGIRLKDLGYGATLRPYLNVGHENGTIVEIDDEDGQTLGITPPFEGMEWSYSKAAMSIGGESAHFGSTTLYSTDLVDNFSLTICGQNITEDNVADDPDESSNAHADQSYVSVGMINEWLKSFKYRSPLDMENDVAVIDSDNALLQLMGDQGAAKEEVLEIIAEGQREDRPWSIHAADYRDEVFAGYARSKLNGSDYVVVQVPCGLLQTSTVSLHGSGSEIVRTQIEVLAIEDM